VSKGNPKTTVRIAPAEKAELAQLAAANGTDLSTAMRKGARLYLHQLSAKERRAA
jgi:hypothetical protein